MTGDIIRRLAQDAWVGHGVHLKEPPGTLIAADLMEKAVEIVEKTRLATVDRLGFDPRVALDDQALRDARGARKAAAGLLRAAAAILEEA